MSNLVGNDSYNCWSFFACIDNVFFKSYSARKPYNILWERVIDKFKTFGGEIIPDDVEKIVDFGVQTKSGTIWFFDKVILCTPPIATLNIIEKSDNRFKNAIMPIEEFRKYAYFNSYPTWVSCSIHFDEEVEFDKKSTHALDGEEWAIIAVVTPIKLKGTTITACTMELDKPSKNGLIANEIASVDILLHEMSRQVCSSLNITKIPSKLVLNPKVKRENGKWVTSDIPYVQSHQFPKKVESETRRKGLFWVGAHNGESNLGVNTMEATCENVLKFCRKFSQVDVPLRHRLRWSEVLCALLFIAFIYYIFK
jgi:hypothetical protein